MTPHHGNPPGCSFRTGLPVIGGLYRSVDGQAIGPAIPDDPGRGPEVTKIFFAGLSISRFAVRRHG
jgi:hypothetical protein